MASHERRRACSPAQDVQPGLKADEKSDRRMEPDDVSQATRTTSMKYSLTRPDGSELMEKGRSVVKAGLPDMIPLDGINVSADVKRHMVPSAVPTIDEQQPDSLTILLCCRPTDGDGKMKVVILGPGKPGSQGAFPELDFAINGVESTVALRKDPRQLGQQIYHQLKQGGRKPCFSVELALREPRRVARVGNTKHAIVVYELPPVHNLLGSTLLATEGFILGMSPLKEGNDQLRIAYKTALFGAPDPTMIEECETTPLIKWLEERTLGALQFVKKQAQAGLSRF
jgi:hypothetical protein